MPNIEFYSEGFEAKFPQKRLVKKWIRELINSKDFSLGEISIIFCTDDYLYEMNMEYLEHDTLTDVITFDYSEENIISGDLFISWDRTKENAETFHVEHLDEVRRVIAHGVLHLMKFKDKTKADQKIMRNEENLALELLKKIS